MNPKFGVRWSFANWLEFRAAAFKALNRTLLGQQTIEQTQIAGFNQFFDDNNGTLTRRYAFGADIKLAESVYTGVEVSRRELKNSVIDSQTADVKIEDQFENSARLYFYHLLNSNFSLGTGYTYEESGKDPVNLDDRPDRIETQKIPIYAKFFHESGFFADAIISYIRQKVKLSPIVNFSEDRENFFVIDGAVGYKNSNRNGIISLSVNNILNEKFLFQEDTIRSVERNDPRYIPSRSIFVRLTFDF